MGQPLEEAADNFGVEELECKICYCAYSLSGWQPRVLECHHHLCAKCLAKIINLSDSSPRAVVCPFCRYVTNLPSGAMGSLPDHPELLKVVPTQNCCFLHQSQPEILPSPGQAMGHLASASPSSALSSNVLTTTMHPAWEPAVLASGVCRSSSLDSVASVTWCCSVWHCVVALCQASGRALVRLLGLLYLSSLPLGIYMFIIQETTLGMLLVCLVPASLLLIMLYGLCHCTCHELWNCVKS